MKALVVEDTADLRFLLQTILEGLGWQTMGAEHGRAALEAIKTHGPFELATVDIFMPVMDGFTFVEAVRKDKALDTMKIMIVSTEMEKSSVDKALRLGADEFLFKPFMRDMVEGKLKLMRLL